MSTEKLQETTRKWKELGRKTEEQRIKAENYYQNNLMKLIEEEYIINNREKLQGSVDYLIMSVGTSYEPLVLNIRLMNPGKILFLYTEKTKHILNKIVSYCNLNISDIEMHRVNETDPTEIYREIKYVYLEWKKPEKLYVDFTGGTKAMSAAAMAGSMIQVQLVYVGTRDYLVDFRKPEPGSETLYFITNPLEVFGDMEVEKAITLFTRKNYSGAAAKLKVLKEQVPDPSMRQQLNFVYLLAESYEAWDALEFQKAYDTIFILNRQLERDYQLHETFWLMDMKDVLKDQEKLLEHMLIISELSKNKDQMGIFEKKQCMVSLMFTIYQNAAVREEQEKYDMATLLLYRLLEMIEQKRLSNYGLNVSHMDYEQIPYVQCGMNKIAAMESTERREWLKKQILAVKSRMFRRPVKVFLSEQISLFDGFALLFILQDEICTKGQLVGLDKLKRIRSMVFLRNNSIFAHGLGPVLQKEYICFRQFVEQLFKEFCQIEKIPFDIVKKQVEWRNPVDSQYYSGLEDARCQ